MATDKRVLAPFTLHGATQCPKCVGATITKTYAAAANDAEVRRTGVSEWLFCRCIDCKYSWEMEVAKVPK